MNRLAVSVCLTCVLALTPVANAQTARTPNGGKAVDAYYPRVLLGSRPGTYLTIEGVSGHEVKGGRDFLVVDTVNDKKLDKPIPVPVSNVRLPEGERCLLKGYELGEMVGQPPAVREAAKEQGIELPPSALPWRWQPYFVVLIPLEPKTLKLTE